jgi:hypothetical protein
MLKISALVLVWVVLFFRPSEALFSNKAKSSGVRKALESRFLGGGNGGPTSSEEKDLWVKELEKLDSPIQSPGLQKQHEKVATGLWRVTHAPHIRNLLQPLLLTDFDVYYQLDKGKMYSFVKFVFRPFPKIRGHLCTYGSYGEVDENTSTIEWDSVWLDFDDKPSKVRETERHVLAGPIQAIGKTAFVKGVSVFPVSYLSDSLIIFTFKLLGTRIVASKLEKGQAEELLM